MGPYNAYKNQQQKNTKGKIDTQKYVLQGSPLYKKEKKSQKRHSEIRLSGVLPIRKGKKKSKETLRNTFIRGTPDNAYKNQQQKNTKGKIDPQKYVLQGSPLNKKKKKRQKRTLRNTFYRGTPNNAYKTNNKKTQRA